MSKLPRVSGRDCAKALDEVGFYLKRRESSHMVLRRDVPFAQLVVPDHRELDRGTLFVSKGGPRRATGCAAAGYQPYHLSKGYRVTQPVDLANLKIPKNLGTAAVRPVNGRNPAPLPAKSEKQ